MDAVPRLRYWVSFKSDGLFCMATTVYGVAEAAFIGGGAAGVYY